MFQNDYPPIDIPSIMELNFGKYKGKSISDVYESDISYCKWLYPQEILIGQYPEIKSFLNDKFKDSDMTYVMNWGKYKKHSIGWIKQNDPKYLEWLRNNEFVHNNCPKLKSALDEL